MKEPPLLLGAIEGGGSKFLCALGVPGRDFLESTNVPTGEPQATLDACVEFFMGAQRRHGTITALGVACFGPLQTDPNAADYGCVLNTPKAGWSGFHLLGKLRAALGVPVALDTDVGAAAQAEWRLGAGRDSGSLVYVTVGTGIGGACAPELPYRRLMHAEMGHLPMRSDPRDAGFAGTCPFHGSCAEGLASGPAILARWGQNLESLPVEHPGRDLIAGYLGQLTASIALLLSPHRIVLGGGVMNDTTMLDRVRTATHEYLQDYLPPLRTRASFDSFLRAPELGTRSGLVGALLLAGAAAGAKHK